MFNYYEINLCNKENMYVCIHIFCISKNEYDKIEFHMSIT